VKPGCSLFLRFLIGRIRKFGLAFLASDLARLGTTRVSHVIHHAAVGARLYRLGPDSGLLGRGGQDRLHGVVPFSSEVTAHGETESVWTRQTGESRACAGGHGRASGVSSKLIPPGEVLAGPF
jgi:hypothetical protein